MRSGDFNFDGLVNLQDFNLLAARFGQMLAAATAPKTGDATRAWDLLADLLA